MSTGVLQMVDSLLVGGAERMGVTLSNLLPRERFRPFLCTTRTDGPLGEFLSGDVPKLHLKREGPVDPAALRRVVHFVRDNGISIIHAHASALFFARLAAMFPPYPKVVWHDHYGRCELNDRPAWLYRLATARIGAVITVNEMLATWARQSLAVPSGKVWYIRNAVETPGHVTPAEDLPGTPGKRILCVANIRPQKDHPTLFRAMVDVVRRDPQAHLILVGDYADAAYKDGVMSQLGELGLTSNVTWLGRRTDIPRIVKACDIAVLSSISEGLPLVLLEYGSLRVPSICTAVGQCAEVLDHGKAGILVPPSDPARLAAEIVSLLGSPERRRQLGDALGDRVDTVYGSKAIVDQLIKVYDTVLPGANR